MAKRNKDILNTRNASIYNLLILDESSVENLKLPAGPNIFNGTVQMTVNITNFLGETVTWTHNITVRFVI